MTRIIHCTLVLVFLTSSSCVKYEEPETYWSNDPHVFNYVEAYGQIFTVLEGEILNSADVPIHGVTVEVMKRVEGAPSGKDMFDAYFGNRKRIARTLSDDGGRFTFSEIEPGEYQVRFSKKGYCTVLCHHVYIVRKNNRLTDQLMKVWMQGE